MQEIINARKDIEFANAVYFSFVFFLLLPLPP